MLSIKSARSLLPDQYQDAMDVEDEIVVPLNQAHNEVFDAVAALDDREVDIREQQEYIRTKVDDMIYQLTQIRDKLEG
jgi:hypothetical protein